MDIALAIFYFISIFLIHIYICHVIAKIAKKKGSSYKSYFWLSFFLTPFIGIIGLLFAIKYDSSTKLECPSCGAQLEKIAKICHQCGKEVSTNNHKVPVGTKREHDIEEKLRDKLGRNPTKAEIERNMWSGD